jgi:hypothetical protein
VAGELLLGILRAFQGEVYAVGKDILLSERAGRVLTGVVAVRLS